MIWCRAVCPSAVASTRPTAHATRLRVELVQLLMEVPNGAKVLEAKNDAVGVVTANLLRMQEEINAFRQTSQEMQDFGSRMRMLIDDARNEILKFKPNTLLPYCFSQEAQRLAGKVPLEDIDLMRTTSASEQSRQEESETEICSLVAENTQQKILNDFLESEEALDVEVVRSVSSLAGSNFEDIWLTRLAELSQYEEICLKSPEALDAEVVRFVPSPAGSNLEDVRLTRLKELSQHEEICLKSLCDVEGW